MGVHKLPNEISVAIGTTVIPTDFGAGGIEADVIAESTAATGVTVDGLLIKDLSIGPCTDNTGLVLGTGSDVTITWNGTYLQSGSGMWANCPSPADPAYHSLVHEYFDDFRHLTVDYDATNEWTVTESDAACTQAIVADIACGELLLTNKAATDNNAQQIVMNQQSFLVATGKKIWFEARFKTAGATEIDWVVGLINAEDMTGVANNFPANGFVLLKTDDATDIFCDATDNGTDITTASIGTWTAATYRKVGFYFDGGATGAATVTPYIDGVAGVACPAVTYATLAKVAPFFMVRNGDAVTTQTMTIDYVKVVQLR